MGVLMLTLLSFQLAFPAGYALAKGLQTNGLVSKTRLETLVDRSVHGNAVIIMALHPPIAKKLVTIIDCAQYNDVRVLSGFKDIECGSGTCTAVALVFICLYTLGVPLYVYLSLRAYLSPAARERFKNNPIMGRYKARIGFICGKFEAQFWYYELLEMARKTGLMAVTSFIQKGSYLQLFAKMLISFFEQEGVDVGVMNSILMFLMFFPLFVATYIIGTAIHEAFAAHIRRYMWPKIKACVW